MPKEATPDPEGGSFEATCPLCLDFFKQPMGLSCGHNFCRDCLAQLDAEVSCPQCKAKVESNSTCPNRALANMVCLVKRLQLPEGVQEESSGQQLCQEHRQPLQIFCSSEKSLLCPSCLGKHQGHPLLSLPEAAQEYKVGTNSLGHFISFLGGAGTGVTQSPQKMGRASWQPGEAHKGYQIKKWLRRTRLFLGSERKEDGGDKLSVAQLLVGPYLPLGPSSRKWGRRLLQVPQPNFKLLPLPPQHLLQNSQDLLKVTAHGGKGNVPGRFDQEFCVLGSEGFTTGWHWWEVSVQGPYSFPVQGKARWAFGVAKESIPRKKSFQLSPQEGIWAVGKNVSGQIVAFEPTQLVLQGSLQRLWVRLDCKTKEVQFLDGATGALLYTFQTGSFLGEMLRPFFYLGQMGVILQCEKYPVKSMRD
uniref:Uncharacterized protein n=1 Tax=Laticauda laticaudata TaxID=8630 RepID=A0A8C5SGA2_LATLA